MRTLSMLHPSILHLSVPHLNVPTPPMTLSQQESLYSLSDGSLLFIPCLIIRELKLTLSSVATQTTSRSKGEVASPKSHQRRPFTRLPNIFKRILLEVIVHRPVSAARNRPMGQFPQPMILCTRLYAVGPSRLPLPTLTVIHRISTQPLHITTITTITTMNMEDRHRRNLVRSLLR